jgi:hypothetical protein
MSDTPPASAAADLAYLKRLAAAGRGEPAPFLLLMAVFGGGYGLSFLSIGVSIHLLGPEAFTLSSQTPFVRLLSWTPFIAHAMFVSALLWTAWRTLGPRRTKLSRAAVAIWSGAFIAFVAVVTTFYLYTEGEPPTDHVYTAYMMPPVLLILWGCAWWVTAMLSERRWLFVVAIGSFIGAVAMAVVGNSPPILMLSAACLLLLACLPAIVLMLERRR